MVPKGHERTAAFRAVVCCCTRCGRAAGTGKGTTCAFLCEYAVICREYLEKAVVKQKPLRL
jgi:hypothetical protein